MSKVDGDPIDPPPPLKCSCNYFLFEVSRVNREKYLLYEYEKKFNEGTVLSTLFFLWRLVKSADEKEPTRL